MSFIERVLQPSYSEAQWMFIDLNGVPGLILRKGDDIVATMTFATAENGAATDIFIMRNPDKLSLLDCIALH